MPRVLEGRISGEGLRFAVVVSRFNDFVSSKLVEGALDALIRHGADDEGISLVKVPGAFEIPFTAKKLVHSGRYDAVICLGAVIRGAIERAGSKGGTRGGDAAVAAMEMVHLNKAIEGAG